MACIDLNRVVLSGLLFMIDLIQGYLSYAGNAIDKLKSYASDKKYEKIVELAHTLDGSSRSIGAIRLSRIANALCKAAQTERKTTALAYLTNLCTAFEQTKTALHAYLKDQESAVL